MVHPCRFGIPEYCRCVVAVPQYCLCAVFAAFCIFFQEIDEAMLIDVIKIMVSQGSGNLHDEAIMITE